MSNSRRTKFNILSILFHPVFIIIDQIIFPMFRLFGFSFKLSYISLLAYPILYGFLRDKRDWEKTKILNSYSIPLVVIIISGIIGQVYLGTFGDQIDSFSAVRQILNYLLMICSLYLGMNNLVDKQQYKILVTWLYLYLVLIFLLSIFPVQMGFVSRFIYGREIDYDYVVDTFAVRPTPFGDGSMVGANILFLIIAVLNKKDFFELFIWQKILLSVAVIFISFLLQGRNQILFSFLVAMYFFISQKSSTKTIFLSIFVVIILFILFFSLVHILEQKIPQLAYAAKRIENTEFFDTDKSNRSNSILRPLLTWQRFIDRFRFSPIIGTGFSILDFYPFNRVNYHNDIFYVFVSSGIIGGIAYLWLTFSIFRKHGFIVILPFFLPGLTNSFLLAIGPIASYFLVIGIIAQNERCKVVAHHICADTQQAGDSNES